MHEGVSVLVCYLIHDGRGMLSVYTHAAYDFNVQSTAYVLA